MAVILNPGFETSGSGVTEAANWTYSETDTFFGSGYSGRGDHSTALASGVGVDSSAVQVGSNCYCLGRSSTTLGLTDLDQNSYCQVAQTIDVTRVKNFTVNLAWKTVYNTPDYFRYSIIVDDGTENELWYTQDSDASSNNPWMAEDIDTSSYTGSADLILRLKHIGTQTTRFIPGCFADAITETLLPDQPTLVTPTNTDDDVNTPTVFDWLDATDATSYNLQVATDNSFSNIVLSSTGISASTHTDTAETLSRGVLYYWRVYGVNANGTGQASSTFSFTTFNVTVPTLSTPANNSDEERLTSKTFTWTGTDEDSDYDIQVATDAAFSSKIIDTSIGSATTSYTMTTNLSKDTFYYWRVRATARTIVSSWATAFLFRTVYGRKCITIAHTPSLIVNDTIGIKMDNDIIHWTRISAVTHTAGVESVICFAEEPHFPTSIGNTVKLPSINNDRWTDDD